MAKKPRTKMPISERAKQFAPFSPLRGLNRALLEKERIRVPRKELSEDASIQLNDALSLVEVGEMITVVYYFREEYIRVTGMVTKRDDENRMLKIVNTPIPYTDIIEIIRSE